VGQTEGKHREGKRRRIDEKSHSMEHKSHHTMEYESLSVIRNQSRTFGQTRDETQPPLSPSKVTITGAERCENLAFKGCDCEK
jgi:hypothetical protein